MLVTSSSPAAVLAAHRDQASGVSRLRQLVAAIFFALGLCYSGRHRQANPTARGMCCNGYRSRLLGDGKSYFRRLSFADPRFAWEAEPIGLQEMHSSVNPKFLKKPGHMPGHDKPFGPPRMSLVERNYAAGRLS